MCSTELLVRSLVGMFLPLFCVVDLETSNGLMPADGSLMMLSRMFIMPGEEHEVRIIWVYLYLLVLRPRESIRSTPCKWTVDDPILGFLWLGNTFLSFIHLLHLFCIRLFSPSEIIFTNDEHVFLRILITNFHVRCFDIHVIPTIYTAQ